MSSRNRALWILVHQLLALSTLRCSSNDVQPRSASSGGAPATQGDPGGAAVGGAITDAGTTRSDSGITNSDAAHNSDSSLSDAATLPDAARVGCPARPAFVCDATVAPQTLDCVIADFGAVGDGVTDDTCAIQAALDRCAAIAQCYSAATTVHVPSGTYLSHGQSLRSNVTLQFDGAAVDAGTPFDSDASIPGEAKIQFTDDFSAYPASNGMPVVVGLINVASANNVAIAGNGVIDGAGAKWWSLFESTWSPAGVDPRPYLVNIVNSTNISISGVTFRNSPKFHVFFQNCTNIDVHGITIRAPSDSPNTDGVDPKSCVHVKISNCDISTGDDNVAISSNARSGYPAPTSADTEVYDCQFGAGHGVSIGSPTYGDVGSMNVHDCTFDGTDNGLRIKSNASSGGIVDGITYSNIELKNVKNVIVLDGYYSDKASIPPLTGDAGTPPAPTTNEPDFRNIYFKNVTATNCGTAGIIRGRIESPFSNITLENVSIAASKGMTIRFADEIHFVNSTITTPTGVLPVILQVDPSSVTGLDWMLDASVP